MGLIYIPQQILLGVAGSAQGQLLVCCRAPLSSPWGRALGGHCAQPLGWKADRLGITGTAVPEGCSVTCPNPAAGFADVWFAANT